MYNYNKTQDSPYDPTKLAMHSILCPETDFISNCGHIFKKTVSFDDIVHFIDEANTMTYVDFDCGITFYPEAPTKLERSTENGKTFPDLVKNPCASQVTINITILLVRSKPLRSF